MIEDKNITTYCFDCKHCKSSFYWPLCKCVGKRDVVTGRIIYEKCSDARLLINDNWDDSDWDGNCQWFKAKLTLWQKIKRLFKKGE